MTIFRMSLFSNPIAILIEFFQKRKHFQFIGVKKYEWATAPFYSSLREPPA